MTYFRPDGNREGSRYCGHVNVFSAAQSIINIQRQPQQIRVEGPVVRNAVPLNIQLMANMVPQAPIETLPFRDALLPTPPRMECRPRCFLHQYLRRAQEAGVYPRLTPFPKRKVRLPS